MRFTRYLRRHDFFQVRKQKRRLHIDLGDVVFISLMAPIAIYPIGSLLFYGPFIGKTFKWRYDVEDKLPVHLQKLVDEEFKHSLERDKRKDIVAGHYLQNGMIKPDSIVRGYLRAIIGGIHTALPFFAQFQSINEAKEYCQKNSETLKLFGSKIDWDSKLGQELIETFVLSENALRFLISRDLEAGKYTPELTNIVLILSSYILLALFALYGIYWYIKRKDAFMLRVLMVCDSPVLLTCLYKKWRYCQGEYDADKVAEKLPIEYARGGAEYYQKMLRRNQLLREILPNGPKLFTPEGNLNRIGYKFLPCYETHRDKLAMMTEDD